MRDIEHRNGAKPPYGFGLRFEAEIAEFLAVLF